MIDAGQIQGLIEKEPFEPFRIRMTDGRAYDVVNPALAVPMESMMFLALPQGKWKFLSYQNMTSLENQDVAA